MAIQVIAKSAGGTIETYFLDRQVTSCTVTVYTGQGGTKGTIGAACTVDPLNTTLSGAAIIGDKLIELASAASCFVGRRYLVGSGPGTTSIAETVTVRSLAASTATLWAPLLSDHAIGTAVKGTRVWYTVSSAAADATWTGGYADFNPNDGSDVQTESVECYLRSIPKAGCDESDLRLVWPSAGKALDAELDLPAAIKQARDRFLYDLGGEARANNFIGTDVFRDCVAMKFWLLRRFSFGPEWATQMDTLQSQYDILIRHIKTQNPADNDQDGTTTGRDDGGFTSGTLERA
jgi:hypothetical protein